MPPKQRAPKRARSEPPVEDVEGVAAMESKAATKKAHPEHTFWTLTYNQNPAELEDVSAPRVSASPQLMLTRIKKFLQDKCRQWIITTEGDGTHTKIHYHVALRFGNALDLDKSYRTDNVPRWYKYLEGAPPELKFKPHDNWYGPLGYCIKKGNIIDNHNVTDDTLEQAKEEYAKFVRNKEWMDFAKGNMIIPVDRLPIYLSLATNEWGCQSDDECYNKLMEAGFTCRVFPRDTVYARAFKKRKLQ